MPGDEVAAPSQAYLKMAQRWDLPLTLWGGTPAMRDAGERYLPKLLSESQLKYERRRDRSFLFNGFKKTVQMLTGKVFSKEIALGDDVPDQIEEWTENVDLTGRNLDTFSRDVFEGGGRSGLAHILVDMQQNDTTATLAAEREAGIRPYMKFIPAEDLIGWRSVIAGGRPVLTMIRIRETTTEDEGEFSEAIKSRIRVIEPTRFRVFERMPNEEYELVEEGDMSLGEIPLATFYAQRLNFLEAEPPFEELAWLNAAHWQSASDQRNILHVARVPILFGTGIPEGDSLEIGADTMIEGPDGSTLTWVEHSGAAIEAGRQDLLDTEERMRIMGIEPLMPRTGNVTATAKAIDTTQANSQLQAMTIGLGNAIEQSFDFMAKWANIGDDGGSVKVNDDFGLSLRDAQDLRSLVELRLAGEISRETLWTEFKRRGVLMDEFDLEQEQERLDEEGSAAGLGMVGQNNEFPQSRLGPREEVIA